MTIKIDPGAAVHHLEQVAKEAGQTARDAAKTVASIPHEVADRLKDAFEAAHKTPVVLDGGDSSNSVDAPSRPPPVGPANGPGAKPKVAFVVSTQGYAWEEVRGAYQQFKNAGWDVEFYTVDGKPAEADPMNTRDYSTTGVLKPVLKYYGDATTPETSPSSPLGQQMLGAMNDVKPVSAFDPAHADAIYVPGGFGAPVDMSGNQALQNAIRTMYDQNKIVGGACHGTAPIAQTLDANGKSIIAGKHVAGTPALAEDLMRLTGQVNDPRYLANNEVNDEILEKAGGKVDRFSELVDPRYSVQDGNIITGMGPNAAAPVADKMIALFNQRQDPSGAQGA